MKIINEVEAQVRRMAELREKRGQPPCNYVVFGDFDFPYETWAVDKMLVLFKKEPSNEPNTIWIVSEDSYNRMKTEENRGWWKHWFRRIRGVR